MEMLSACIAILFFALVVLMFAHEAVIQILAISYQSKEEKERLMIETGAAYSQSPVK